MAVDRERAWDILLNGVAYRVVRDERGVPLWKEPSMPATQGKDIELFQRERRYDTWHLGAGYTDMAFPGAYGYALGVDARFPRQLLPGPKVHSVTDGGGAQIHSFFEQSGLLYFLTNRYCHRIVPNATETTDDTIATLTGNNATGCDFDDNGTFGDGTGHVPSIGVGFDGNTYIGFTSSGHHIFKFTGSAWSVSAAGVIGAYGTKWWSDNAEDWVLAGAPTTTPQVSVCAQGSDPLLAPSWSAAIDIGDTSNLITGMAGSERTLWVAKTDGLYYVHLTRTPRVLETKVYDANNGKNMLVDQAGMVYYPCKEGFYRYDPTTGEAMDISPGRGLPNSLSIGPVTAACTYRGWLYVATWDGTNALICVGRPREQGEEGIGPIIWHGSLIAAQSAKITAMHVTGITTNPRLYWGQTDGKVCHIMLPRFGDNPALDANCEYNQSGDIFFCFDNWDVPGSWWQALLVEVESANMSATYYASLSMDFDGATSGTTLGTVTKSPRQIFAIPTAITTLSTAVDSDDTTVVVASNTGFPATNDRYIQIDSEVMLVTAGSTGTSWTVTRAQRGTTAAAHVVGAFITGHDQFTNMRLRLVFTTGTSPNKNASNIKGITVFAVQRVDLFTMIETQLYVSDRVASNFEVSHRVSGKQQLANLRALQENTFVQLKDWWTGSARTQTVLVGPVKAVLVKDTKLDTVDMVATISIGIIA